MERLQKVLAKAGVASRRKAEEYIAAGRVKVDDDVITQMGFIVKKGSVVKFDDEVVAGENKVYYLLYKPRKVLSTVTDPRGRQTVLDLVSVNERIFPVGRLDYDTSGLLILSNDGEFTNLLTHPRYHLEKKYEVSINGVLDQSQIDEIKKGMTLEDGTKLQSVDILLKRINPNTNSSEWFLTLREGKNRQIRRMMETFGFEVKRLHRYQMAFLDLKDVKMGTYRRLKPFEVKRLVELAKNGKDL